jgi:hypothetical protein
MQKNRRRKSHAWAPLTKSGQLFRKFTKSSAHSARLV